MSKAAIRVKTNQKLAHGFIRAPSVPAKSRAADKHASLRYFRTTYGLK